MREGIHPEYKQVKVRCNCGNEFVTGSTKDEIRVEVCSKCHPFYTGSQKLLLEAGGRVEKFNKKLRQKVILFGLQSCKKSRQIKRARSQDLRSFFMQEDCRKKESMICCRNGLSLGGSVTLSEGR